MDTLNILLASPVAVVANGMMLFILLETWLTAARGGAWVRRARHLLRDRECLGRWQCSRADHDLTIWELERSSRALELISRIAPLVGLGWTMASFMLAIPSLDGGQTAGSSSFFSRMGLGPSSSLIGFICTLIAEWQHHHIRETLLRIDRLDPPVLPMRHRTDPRPPEPPVTRKPAHAPAPKPRVTPPDDRPRPGTRSNGAIQDLPPEGAHT